MALLAIGLVVDPQEGEGSLWIIVGAGALLVGYLGYAMTRSIQRLRRT